MMERYGIVYKVTSPSGQVYIGQTIQGLKQRRWKHESAARCKNNPMYESKFSHAIRKYGLLLKWEILFLGIPVSKLDGLEEQSIKLYDSYKNGYNQQPTAAFNRSGIAPWNKGKKNPYSEESLRQRSLALTGKKCSEETRKKQSIAKLGKKLTDEHKAKISFSMRKRTQ